MRPHPGAPVSTPVTWAEIEGVPPRFSMKTVWERLNQMGDLFSPILTIDQDLRRATALLRSMR